MNELKAAGINDPVIADSYRRSKKLNSQHGKTYYLATLLLPAAKRDGYPVKVLGNGDISVKVNVTVQGFSASASEKIVAAGGTITAVKQAK